MVLLADGNKPEPDSCPMFDRRGEQIVLELAEQDYLAAKAEPRVAQPPIGCLLLPPGTAN